MVKFVKIFSFVVEVLTSLLPIVSKLSKTEEKNRNVSNVNGDPDDKQ